MRNRRIGQPQPGFVRHLQLGLDLAVLLVTVPRWTRLNVYATRPDAPRSQPVTDAVIIVSALERSWQAA